jgi:phosphatidylcholine synthase
MVYWFQLVPAGLEIVIPAGMFLVSLYTFANLNMKTSDFYFSGFPAVWNIVVLYFYILDTNEWLNLLVIIFFYVLTFIPIKFIHPLRVKKLRNINIFTTILWSATTLKLITTNSEINLFTSERIVMFIWIVCSIYFAFVCLNRSFKNKL